MTSPGEVKGLNNNKQKKSPVVTSKESSVLDRNEEARKTSRHIRQEAGWAGSLRLVQMKPEHRMLVRAQQEPPRGL